MRSFSEKKKIKTPSQKQDEAMKAKLERDKRHQDAADEAKQLIKAFRQVAGTKAGLIVFRWFVKHCGYHDPDTVRQVTVSQDGKSMCYGDILPNTTIHNAAIRSVWGEARKQLTPKNIVDIETKEDDSDVN